MLLCVLFLVGVNAVGSCNSNCTTCTLYERWNLEITNNSGNACSSFSLSTPTGLSKVTYSNPSSVTLRRDLFVYKANANPPCRAYCPPGSYL